MLSPAMCLSLLVEGCRGEVGRLVGSCVRVDWLIERAGKVIWDSKSIAGIWIAAAAAAARLCIYLIGRWRVDRIITTAQKSLVRGRSVLQLSSAPPGDYAPCYPSGRSAAGKADESKFTASEDVRGVFGLSVYTESRGSVSVLTNMHAPIYPRRQRIDRSIGLLGSPSVRSLERS